MPAPAGRRGFLRLGAAAAPVVLAGCSGLQLVDAVAPADGYTLRPAIQYGPDPRQAMDAYLPARLEGGAPPLAAATVVIALTRAARSRDRP